MAEQNVADVPQHFDHEDSFSGDNSNSGDFEGGDGAGSASAAGGQSKSSRRRRRKRRNKVAGEPDTQETGSTAGAPAPVVMEGEVLALAASAPLAERAVPAPRRSHGGSDRGGAERGTPERSSDRGSDRNSQGAGSAGQAQTIASNSGGTSQNGFPGGNGAGQTQTNGAAAGPGKRWKKKFRDRERRPGRSENPGNEARPAFNSGPPQASNGGGYAGGSFSGGSSHAGTVAGSYSDSGGGYSRGGRPDNFGNRDGFKRKNRPAGGGPRDRNFVGPMDHSYREGNGNDAPPSTIQVHTHARRSGHRHQGDSQPLDFSGPRPIPIPENAQTHIYFFIEDLFLTAKIQETSRKQGVKVAFVKNEKDAVAELTLGEGENRPALIVFDLNNANAKPLTLIPKLKSKLKRSVSIIGFLSHLQGDLKAKAVEAGCDVVVPRAAFSQNLPNLLRRYGVEEEDEVNFNY